MNSIQKSVFFSIYGVKCHRRYFCSQGLRDFSYQCTMEYGLYGNIFLLCLETDIDSII